MENKITNHDYDRYIFTNPEFKKLIVEITAARLAQTISGNKGNIAIFIKW